MQKKVVLTGGTYAGKSALLDLLKNEGYSVVPEAGQIVIAELNEKLGIERQKRWRIENPEKFYTLIIDKQRELEFDADKSGNYIIFLDRAIPDYLAFLRLAGIEIAEHLWQTVKNYRYDLVFICEPLDGFDERTSTGRSFNREASQTLSLLTKEIYEKVGYTTYNLEIAPLEKRMQRLLELSRADTD